MGQDISGDIMTYNLHSLMRLRVKAEPHDSFAVDMTSAMSTWVDIPLREGSCTHVTEQPTENPKLASNNMYYSDGDILLQKKGTMSFECNLSPSGIVAASGITALQTPIGYLLGVAMDGENAAYGSSINVIYSEDMFDLTSDYSGIEPGAAIGHLNDGVLEVREVTYCNKSIIAIKQTFTPTLQEADVIYASRTYYYDGHTPANISSLQAVKDGYDYKNKDDTWIYSGGQLSNPLKITARNGKIPFIGFDWMFADWDNADDKIYRAAGDGMKHASYSNNQDLCVIDSEVRIDEIGSTSAVDTYPVNDIRIDLGVKYVPVRGPGGTNGIVHYRMDVKKPVVKCEITLPYEDQTFYDYMANKTDLYIAYQIGRAISTGSIMISIPTAQVTGVKRVDMGGLMGQRITMIGRDDEYTTESAQTNIGMAKSPFRVHIF